MTLAQIQSAAAANKSHHFSFKEKNDPIIHYWWLQLLKMQLVLQPVMAWKENCPITTGLRMKRGDQKAKWELGSQTLPGEGKLRKGRILHKCFLYFQKLHLSAHGKMHCNSHVSFFPACATFLSPFWDLLPGPQTPQSLPCSEQSLRSSLD